MKAEHDYLKLFITSYQCMSPCMFMNNWNLRGFKCLNKTNNHMRMSLTITVFFDTYISIAKCYNVSCNNESYSYMPCT